MKESIRLSSSTSKALHVAYRRSLDRGGTEISSIDVLVGVFRSHQDSSEPLVLLTHAQVSLEKFGQRITEQDGGFGPRGTLMPGTIGEDKSGSGGQGGSNDRETVEILEVAEKLAGEYATEAGVTRLRDLFGGILLTENQASHLLQVALSESFIPLDTIRSTYPEFLEWKEKPPSFAEFLSERHPPPRFPVSGFSADTIADEDFVGIGPEVNAMAYLITAKSLTPPLAIGLFGDWGSGKSFFIRALRRRINTITQDARNSERPQREIDLYKYVVQIEFNAWHYVEGELWASLVEHILRNLQLGTESETELQIRKKHWIRKLHEARKEDEGLENLRTTLEAELEDKKADVDKAQKEAEKNRQELEHLTLDGVWAVMDVPGHVKEQVGDVLRAAGLDSVPESAMSLAAALEQSRNLWHRGSAVLAPLRASGQPRLRWLLAVLTIAFIGPLISITLGQFPLSELNRLFISLGGVMSTAGVAIASANKWVADQLNKAEHAAEELEKQRLAAQETYIDRVAKLRTEQSEMENELATVKHEANKKRQEIAELERELDGLTPGRVLLDFINERVGSDDYRQHLGVAALIRRDFDKLSELIASSNKKFIETDTGKITEDDKHRINRIVLYIDDLDRCPPERVVEVLQAVHLLMAFPLFVVVVAVDSRWLSQSLQAHYEKLLAQDNGQQVDRAQQATADDYLEKIFQIPFWIKPLAENSRMRIVQGLVAGSLVREEQQEKRREKKSGAINDIVEWHASEHERPLKLDAATELKPKSLEITQPELDCMEALKGLLGESPRSVKRFVNVYRLIKAGESGRVNNFISEADDADYVVVLFLLALVTGLPHALISLIQSENGINGDNTIAAALEALSNRDLSQQTLTELGHMTAWLERDGGVRWRNVPISRLLDWSDQVRRYSYRL